MDIRLREILQQLAAGILNAESAERAIADLNGTTHAPHSYSEMGHTKLDIGRRSRRGVTEAIYCGGKTAPQLLDIIARLDEAKQNVLCTRVSPELAAEILISRPDLEHHADARMLVKRNEAARAHGQILVLSAGTSDQPVAREATISAELLGNRVETIFDVGVAGIHRLFGAAGEAMQRANVIIVAAGMEGALPSVVAGLVGVPVIAVPTSVGYGASFGGIAALLGMLNSCSGGIAVVNIDNGYGAALLAHLINHAGERPANSALESGIAHH